MKERFALFDDSEEVAGGDAAACCDADFLDDAGNRCGDRRLHLHGLRDHQRVALLDDIALGCNQAQDRA